MHVLTPQIVDHLVSKAGRLYSLPAVAVRVLQLTDDPRVDTRTLKECIEHDPALTTKVLRVVNSSLFGLSREVSDLNQALALLGTKPLKLLVLGFSLPVEFFAGLTAEMLGRYWRHTLTKAVAARAIGEAVRRQSGDEAFIAGLLQDLGMLLLIQEMGPPYVEFLDKVRQRGADLLSLETESLGFDHTLLSSRLLEHWGLPATLVTAVRREAVDHAPAAGTQEDGNLAQIVRLAELVAQFLAEGQSEAFDPLLRDGERYYGLSPKRLEEIVATLEEKVGQLADVLSLKLPQGCDYRDLMVQAHQRLAEAAAEAAGDLLRQRNPPSSAALDPSLMEQVQSLHEAVAQIARRGIRSPALAVDDPAPEQATPSEATSPAPPAHVACATLLRSAAATAAETDPGLLGRLAAAVIECRRARCALSLLLVGLNDAEELVLTSGVQGLQRVLGFLEKTCRGLDHPRAACIPHGEAGFAMILRDCDRSQAVQMGNSLIDRMRRLAAIGGQRRPPTLNISVGVAAVSLPPKNFPAGELVTAADHCLYGSRASGGGVVKSIEIY